VRGFLSRRRCGRLRQIVQAYREAEAERLIEESLVAAKTQEECPVDIVPPAVIHVDINGTALEMTLTRDGGEIEGDWDNVKIVATEIVSGKSSSITIVARDLCKMAALFNCRPLSYSTAIFHIRKLFVQSLNSVDMLGKSNPLYCAMSCGSKWNAKTRVCERSSSAQWDVSTDNFQLIVSKSDLRNEFIRLFLMETNQFRSHTSLGQIDVPLLALESVSLYGQVCTLSGTLLKNEKPSASLSITADILPTNPLEEPLSRTELLNLHQMLTDPVLLSEFLVYLSSTHLDLFFSRAAGVMILKMNPLH
jgi:hypothetical protein